MHHRWTNAVPLRDPAVSAAGLAVPTPPTLTADVADSTVSGRYKAGRDVSGVVMPPIDSDTGPSVLGDPESCRRSIPDDRPAPRGRERDRDPQLPQG